MSYIYYKTIILPEKIYKCQAADRQRGDEVCNDVRSDIWQDEYRDLLSNFFKYLIYNSYQHSADFSVRKEDYSIVIEKEYGDDLVFKQHVSKISLPEIYAIFEFLRQNNCILINYYNSHYVGSAIGDYLRDLLRCGMNKNFKQRARLNYNNFLLSDNEKDLERFP